MIEKSGVIDGLTYIAFYDDNDGVLLSGVIDDVGFSIDTYNLITFRKRGRYNQQRYNAVKKLLKINVLNNNTQGEN